MTIIQQPPISRLNTAIELYQENEQGDNAIFLTNDEIAKLIQVRFLFERFEFGDLIDALKLWKKASGVKQGLERFIEPTERANEPTT